MGILRTDKISGLETPTSNDFGPNLLYNGDFSNGSVGWSAVNSNHTVSSGQLTVTNTGTNGRATSTAFDTVIGEVYEISIHNVSTTGQFRLEIREGNGYGSENAFDSNNSVAGVRTLRFVATETAHSLVVYAIGGSGTTSVYSDITVRKINKLVTGSVHFDGAGDYLSFATSTDFALGTDDWTVEWFAYPTSTTQYQRHFYLQGSSSSQIDGVFANPDGIAFGRTGVWASSATANPLNQWNHYALVHDSTNMRLYINGVESLTSTNNFGTDSTKTLNIGYSNSTFGGYFTGNISNFRILRGTALYTSDFTVPTHELEVIGDTVLLCCNNPDSAGAEATGKTITVNGDAAASTFSPGLTRDFTSGTEFRGVTTFDTQAYFVPPSGTTEQRGRGRGLFGGGDPGVNSISYITIASMGNAFEFGDLSEARLGLGSAASSTRALFAGGHQSGNKDTIDFVTIATTGNAVAFGELVGSDRHEIAGASNSIRGLFAGGSKSASPNLSNEIDYVTIASAGDATDFGNLTLARRNITGVMSPTRAVFCGGRNDTPSPSTQQEEMDYVTIATTGNALDFGDLTVARGRMGSVCSSTRGVIGGGEGSPADSNVIDYITIASTGNAQDFGDMITASEGDTGGCSNSLRGVFGGHSPSTRNIMEYVTISSTGNSQDFGDLTYSTSRKTGCSDSHGGLS